MLDLRTERLQSMIAQWLEEDIGAGDVTTLSTVPSSHQSKGIIHAKDAGVVCGLSVAEMVFHLVDNEVTFLAQVKEGSTVSKGTIIAIAEGNTRSILMAERLALNLLQRMSGIATRTRTYVDAIGEWQARLVDTRKTTPGHRILEKYAVRCGGGHNHRFGLYDAVMIKDNHIKASGGIRQAVHTARAAIPHTMKIEVEVESIQQVEEALEAGADIIMLDNMAVPDMTAANEMIKHHAPHIVVEASGNVSLETINGIASSGVDVISVGSLTLSVKPLDISLDLNAIKEGAQ